MSRDVDTEEIETRLFLEAIHAAYGYDFREYGEASIRRRVLAALAKSGLDHLGELQHAVLHDSELLGRVIDDLTVRVTEMFRGPATFRAFRTHVVPLLRTYPHLKIWHAGCATGEEVYSTAIVLEEEGLYERAQIYATDLNPSALEHAKQGVYALDTEEAFVANHRASGGTSDPTSFITRAYSKYAFPERLRKNVLFFQHDLVNDHAFGEMNVVFCRNVLVYFGPELRRRAVGKLARSVVPGGFLCLGSAEQLPRDALSEPFLDVVPASNIYRRER